MKSFLPVLSFLLNSLLVFSQKEGIAQPYNKAQTFFTPNQGQIINEQGEPMPGILAKASVPGMDVYITQTGITYVLLKYEEDLEAAPHPVYFNETKYKIHYSRVDVELPGAAITTGQIKFEGELPRQSNYYYSADGVGNLDVKHYKALAIQNIYPGIDLVWKCTPENRLEYDFVVHAGSNAAQIKMKYKYADLKPEGNHLTIHTNNGSVIEGPLQAICGESAVEIQYSLDPVANEITFTTGSYDRQKDLLIDPPLALDWSAQFGGAFYNGLRGVDTDTSGYIYLTGYTTSPNFPAVNPGNGVYFDSTFAGTSDAVLLKIDTLQNIKWATFFGGPGADYGNSVAVSKAGVIHVTGMAWMGFPITNEIGSYNQSTVQGSEAYVAVFDSTLKLKWSTFLGGPGNEEGLKIHYMDTADSYYAAVKGRIYVTGYTTSNTTNTFPTNGYPAFLSSGSTGTSAFIARFNGHKLNWGTIYGGNGNEYATSIASDSLNNTVVTGFTTSTNFPLLTDSLAYNQSGNSGVTDGFILRFNNYNVRLHATYFGGNENDYFTDVACGDNGNFIFTGRTISTNFPIDSAPGFAYNQTHLKDSNSYDAFLVKCLNNGKVGWATYYGGSDLDAATGITIDHNGGMYITGFTSSKDFPLDSFPGAYYQANNRGNVDGFVAHFTSLGIRKWSTYKGDTCFEYPADIKYDSRFDRFYVVGEGLLACNIANPDSGGQSLPDTSQVNSQGVASTGLCWAFGGQGIVECGISLFVDKDIFYCDQCSGTARAFISGGTPPFSTLWNNSVSSIVNNSLCLGQNWVQVRDSAGCIAEQTFFALPLSVGFEITPITCYPATIKAKVNEGDLTNSNYSYQWSGPYYAAMGDDAITDISQPAIYKVTVTDNNGCTASATAFPNYHNSYANLKMKIIEYPKCSTYNSGKIALVPVSFDPPTPSISWFSSFYPSIITKGDTFFDAHQNEPITAVDSAHCINGVPTQYSITFPPYSSFASTYVLQPVTTCAPAIPNGLAEAYFYPNHTIEYNVSTQLYPLYVDIVNPPNMYYYWDHDWYTSSDYKSGLSVGTHVVYVTESNYSCGTEYSINVVANPDLPNLSNNSVAVPVSCLGKSDGQINVQISDVVNGPFSYHWSNGATTSTITNLKQATYSVTVQGITQCPATFNFNVNYAGSNLLDIGPAQHITDCNMDSIYVRFQNSYPGKTITYQWSSGLADSFITSGTSRIYHPSGNYSITATTNSNVSASACFVMADTLAAQITSRPYTCDSGWVEGAIIGGGVAPYNILWSTGDSTIAFNRAFAGPLGITAKDKRGCFLSITNDIKGSTLDASISTDSIACFGDLAIVSVNASGGFPPYQNTGSYTYPAGQYMLFITDSVGCEKQVNINLQQPAALTVNNSVTPPSCFGDSGTIVITGNGGVSPYIGIGMFKYPAGEYVFLITDANGCISDDTVHLTQPDSLMVQVVTGSFSCTDTLEVLVNAIGGTGIFTGTGTFLFTDTGYHLITVTDENGCTAQSFIFQPPSLNVFVNTDTIPCFGASATVSVIANGGFSPYQNTGTYTYSAGSYVLYVTDSLGCQRRVNISLPEPQPLSLNNTVTPPLCYGDIGIITISGNGGTAPYNGIGAFNYAAGSYPFTITDARGCVANDTFEITQPEPVSIELAFTDTSFCGDTITVLVSAVGGNGNFAGTGTQFFTISGLHSITVMDNNGCWADTAIFIRTNNCTGINNLGQAPAVFVYPNPATNTFFVRSSSLSHSTMHLQLFAMDGKLLIENMMASGNDLLEMNCSHLASGVYNLGVESDHIITFYKIVIAK